MAAIYKRLVLFSHLVPLAQELTFPLSDLVAAGLRLLSLPTQFDVHNTSGRIFTPC